MILAILLLLIGASAHPLDLVPDFPNLIVKQSSPTSSGLFSTTSLYPGDVVVKIPLTTTLSSATFTDSDDEALARIYGKLPPDTPSFDHLIILFIYVQHTPSHPLHEYIVRCLNTAPTLPATFTPSAINSNYPQNSGFDYELSYLKRASHKSQQFLIKYGKILHNTVPDTLNETNLNPNLIMTAYAIIKSRYFTKAGVHRLVPVADMMNFPGSLSPNKNFNHCITCATSTGHVTCTTHCHIPAGNELTFFYGDYCAAHMNVVYGFSNDLSRGVSCHPNPARNGAEKEAKSPFRNWVDAESGIEHSLVLQRFGGLRGVAALRDIHAGDYFVKVPLESTFSMHSFVTDPTLAGLHETLSQPPNELDEFDFIMVLLLYHHGLGNKTPFDEYLRVIQETDVDTFPAIMASRGEKSETWDDFITSTVEAKLYESRYFLETVVPVLVTALPDVFRASALTHSKVLWAYEIVTSRYFHLPDADRDSVPNAPRIASMMVPLVDLLNFPDEDEQAECVTCDVSPPDEWSSEYYFACVSHCDIKAGEQIFFYYGDHCKSYMVGMYGFSNDLNRDECDETDFDVGNEYGDEL